MGLGSPILTRVRIATLPLRDYQPAGGAHEALDDRPLEARVEPMPIAFAQGGHEMALDLRLVMGRYWCKLVEPLAAGARDGYIAKYPVHVPDPLQEGRCADVRAPRKPGRHSRRRRRA